MKHFLQVVQERAQYFLLTAQLDNTFRALKRLDTSASYDNYFRSFYKLPSDTRVIGLGRDNYFISNSVDKLLQNRLTTQTLEEKIFDLVGEYVKKNAQKYHGPSFFDFGLYHQISASLIKANWFGFNDKKDNALDIQTGLVEHKRFYKNLVGLLSHIADYYGADKKEILTTFSTQFLYNTLFKQNKIDNHTMALPTLSDYTFYRFSTREALQLFDFIYEPLRSEGIYFNHTVSKITEQFNNVTQQFQALINNLGQNSNLDTQEPLFFLSYSLSVMKPEDFKARFHNISSFAEFSHVIQEGEKAVIEKNSIKQVLEVLVKDTQPPMASVNPEARKSVHKI